MKSIQLIFTLDEGWKGMGNSAPSANAEANLVLGFGSRELLSDASRFQELKNLFPNAHILLNSTSGEISGIQVTDNTIVVSAIQFEKTKVRVASINIASVKDSREAGKTIASALPKEELAFVFIISDGQKVNGSELVKGIHDVIPPEVPVTGGLAGDGSKFEKTLVGLDAAPIEGLIVVVGFYGKNLRVAHGSQGGWDLFGPSRKITKSKSNVLYELDGRNALELYKTYLGDHAKDLPASALLFPLSVELEKGSAPVVRTILSIDEQEQSMVFAGDIPEGVYSKFMKANFDKLVDGAQSAAQATFEGLNNFQPQLAILISCVGRKLVLGPRIEEEVEVVRDIFGKDVPMIGFYSYGEISPFNLNSKCELHNQTMTITALSEE